MKKIALNRYREYKYNQYNSIINLKKKILFNRINVLFCQIKEVLFVNKWQSFIILFYCIRVQSENVVERGNVYLYKYRVDGVVIDMARVFF